MCEEKDKKEGKTLRKSLLVLPGGRHPISVVVVPKHYVLAEPLLSSASLSDLVSWQVHNAGQSAQLSAPLLFSILHHLPVPLPPSPPPRWIWMAQGQYLRIWMVDGKLSLSLSQVSFDGWGGRGEQWVRRPEREGPTEWDMGEKRIRMWLQFCSVFSKYFLRPII